MFIIGYMKNIILFMTVLFFSACSTVSGTVFYDMNVNGKMDQGEAMAKYYPIEVTFNGNVIESGTTDANGKFVVKGRGSGSYCVRFLQKSDSTKITKDVSQTSSQTTGQTTDTSAQGTTTTEKKPEEKPKGTDYATMHSKVGEWTGDDQFCQSTTNYNLSMSPVGLKMDYKLSEDESAAVEEKLNSGEVFYLRITHSKMCKLKPLKVPSYIDLTTTGQEDEAWITTSGYLHFKELELAKGDDEFSDKAAKETVTRIARLKVTTSKTELQFVLYPVADCPDGENKLPEIKLNINPPAN